MRCHATMMPVLLAVLVLSLSPSGNVPAYAEMIYGTPGDDFIEIPSPEVVDGIFSYEGDDSILIESGAGVASDDQVAAEAIAAGEAIAIDAGGGNDRVTNNGTVSANAAANGLPADGTASQATANAAGMSAGDGMDVVQNSSMIAVTATSNSGSGDISLALEGNTQFQSMTASTATAMGIDGGSGGSQVTSTGVIASIATSESEASSVNVNVGDSGTADVRTLANATAAGISGGNGKDEITAREGNIAVDAAVNVNSVNALVTIDAENESMVTGSSLSDASVTADAVARGIYGGKGDDGIVNDNTEISADADAYATAVGVSLMVSGSLEGNTQGKALSDSSAGADATATGIDADAGNDTIENGGNIFANADSTLTALGVGADITVAEGGNASGAALSAASVTANAAATGIDGGGDADTVDNRGEIGLIAEAGATGVSVALDVAGTVKGDAEGLSVTDSSTRAQASAIGITGGAGDDTIINDSLATTTNAAASAIGVSVGLTVSGSMEGNVEGKALSDASVMADATTTGIDGGSGHDSIDNWSSLSSRVAANATGVAASLQVGFTKEGDASPEALAEGSALSDASVTANAAATGIDGGGGGDAIDNRGDIELLGRSAATGVSVALDVAGTMKGDAGGSSASNSSVTAKSSAVGIEGGEGKDTIDNEGMITLMSGIGDEETDASATAVSVALTVSGSMEGNVAGEALSDSSATADAAATGIDGGSGIDEITNRGGILGNVDSSATGVGVGLDVNIIVAKEGDVEGDVSGAALSDASVGANAVATGIDGGKEGDTIDNRGNIGLSASTDAVGVAASIAVAGSVATEGGVEGEIEGKALSDVRTEAYAETTGIDGGEDSDQITNTGDFSVLRAESNSTGVSASLNISSGLAANGDAKVNVTGEAASDARVSAQAATSAIKGASGDDEVFNEGDFVDVGSHSEATSVAASLDITGAIAFKGDADASTTGSAVSSASANALTTTVAIDGGVGNDIIHNTGDIINLESDSTATSVSAGANVSSVVAIKGNAEADVTGEAVGDSRVTAQAMALGLDGGLGDDEIDNEGDISLFSTADATGVAAELNVSAALNFKGVSTADVSGTAASNSSVSAKSEVTAIDGGRGQDTIRNSGDIILMNEDVFDADALGVSASLNISGNVAIKGVAAGTVEGTAASNATVTAEATATGIDGFGDNDIIDNTGAIEVLPSSNAEGIAASLNVSGNMVGETEGSAMSDASVTARSTATGINGGEGDDRISNEGSITLMKQEASEDEVDANALGVAASLDITGNLNGTAEGQALSKATTTAEAAATGIDGGSGLDDITNTAAITADVDSHAEGVAVAAGVSVTGNGVAEGGSLSDVSTAAKAKAAGIDGGEDHDTIDNSGVIQLFSDADATSTAVSLTVSGTLRGQASGEALSKATTTADATAVGINGGEGLDEITNMELISANASATTDAVAVAGGLSFTLAGTAEGAALSDLSSISSAIAKGIDGGEGDDIIDNKGPMALFSLSDAQATGVSVGLTGAMKGMAEGKSVANSSAGAISQSIGIDGGEGNDTITSSTHPITSFAQSLSDAESVSVQGTGAVGMAKGAAVADSSASSVSYSAGMDGGLGNDTIENASEIQATAKADAEASSTTVGVTIGLGVADTIGTGDSSATAAAVATGIEGGGDDDKITNTAAISVGGLENTGPMASAQAESTTVTVGIAAGLNMGEASSNAASLVEVNAAGLGSGSGADWIHNTGDITVGPDPMGTGSIASASAKSTTVKVDVTLGASLGESSSDTSSTAIANLAGIQTGSGDDRVYNTGAITVGTDPYDPGKPEAMAKAKAASETVDVGITIGGSFSDASSNASGTALSTVKGIETDQGSDWISNSAPIKAFSSSEAVGLAETTKVSLSLGVSEGGAQSDASSLSRALATGIDSGSDADEISTDSELTVIARSTGTAISTAQNYNILSVGAALQSAEANSSSTAEAIAGGIEGGTGSDIITASGTLSVTADSFVESQSRSSTVTGLALGVNVQEAQSRAETVAESQAVGIHGGEDNDTINSTAEITVNALSNAFTQATSATNTGFNIAGASSGESVAGAATNVSAIGIGILGGTSELATDQTDADVINNQGPISVTTTVSATTQSTSTADSVTLIGSATGKAVSDASARVLAEGMGIDGGADNDTITNKDTLTVKTEANGSVSSTSNVDSDVVFGDASSKGASDASVNVGAEATGIDGGTDDDVISNEGLLAIEATSTGSVNATSNVNADVTFGGASSKAMSDASATRRAKALGIDGGQGADVITNQDRLRVLATSDGTVTSRSHANADAIFGSTSSSTVTAAAAEGAAASAGITSGSEDDKITNLGYVDSIAEAKLNVFSSSVSISDSTFGDAYAAAVSVSTAQGTAASTGLSADEGNDTIENEGVINVRASSTTTVNSITAAIADSTFGDADTVAKSANFAAGETTAKGLSAGKGKDEILNSGLISVEADNTVAVNALTVSSSGPAYSNAGTYALASAQGIDGGTDEDGVLNADTVFVKVKPRILSATRTFGSGGNVDGKVGIRLSGTATGITGGEGNDAIDNEGNVLVFAGVSETGSTVSEDARSGSTRITDNSFSTPTDPEELVGKWIRIAGGENPDFFTQVVAFDPQAGAFTLREALEYDLSAGTAYTLYDYGVKEPDITSLNVTAGGRTRVDASTVASVQAKGIVGGDGDDQIANAGTTAVSASNLVKTVTLSFTRNIRADTRIESNVNAVGIEGNDQSSVTDVSDGATKVFTDLSRKGEDPDAIVGKAVLFKSGASVDFFTFVEAFDPETGTFTLADPLPSGGLMRGDMYTLGGGSDSIANLGAIDVRADSAIDASSWSFSFRGADIEVRGQAQALTTGMRGGELDDSMQNLGPIVTRSTADVSSTERVTVKFGEEAEQKLSFEASSNSVGVEAGAGDDKFTNAENGSIDAEAVSTANIDGGVTTTYGTYWLPTGETKTINLTDAIAQSTALSIDLGSGHDIMSSEGVFQASANAVADAKAISDFDLFSETDADADAVAKASAWGIRAGSGGDQIQNHNLILVDASAGATSFAQGAKVGNEDDTSTVTENSLAGSNEFIDASLEGENPQYLVGKWVRFLTGENEDFFTRIVGFAPSTGTITLLDELPYDLKAAVLDDEGNIITPADVYTFSAARDGASASVASAMASGIDVGVGNAIVENTGVIHVKASAKADTAASTFGGQVTVQANASSDARGIRTGTGDDLIRNAGVMDVESEVSTTTSGGSTTEIATATGIDAGGGNNKIANEGVINVTASVDQPNGEADARGILTGEGDDTIINSGPIVSSNVINGAIESGIGIATGAGNDTVALDEGTLVEGSINLGEGNDALAFSGSPMVRGEVTGENGTDSLMFEGAGSIGFGVSEFEGATKQGHGTFTVASLTTMQRVEVNEGTLEINEDYQLADDGIFRAKVYGGGDCGQLKINGEAGLAGTLDVVKGPGAYANGTKYGVLVADTTTDWFGEEVMPELTPLVSFQASGYPDRVEVESLVKSFTTVANNPVHRTIGQYMDRILPTASGDLSEVLGEFQDLSSVPQFYLAFSSLSPDSYDNATRTTYEVTRQYTKILQQRMRSLRPTLASASTQSRARSDREPLLLAYSGSNESIGGLVDARRQTEEQKRYGLWLQGFGQWGDQDEAEGYSGFDYDMAGITFGFDYAFTDRVISGISVGYADTDIDLGRNAGSGEIESVAGSLYSCYFTERAYLEGVFSYGNQQYDNERNLVIGSMARTARSDHDGDLFSAFVEGGYNLGFRGWTLSPFASLQYIYLDEESFVESGAGAVSLLVDDRTTDSLVSALGLRLGRVFQTATGSLVPELSLAWKYDFDIDDRDITAGFAGSPGAAFTIRGQDFDDHGVLFGAGLTFMHKSGFSTSLEYNGELRGDYSAHGVMGMIRYVW